MKYRPSVEMLQNEDQGNDFVVRRRRLKLWQIPLLFAVTFSLIYFAAHSIEGESGKLSFIAMLAVVIGALSWFVVSFTQSNRDMLLVAEFQNALFASAASLATRFCMIAKRDGSIVYFDPGFQSIFQDFIKKDLRSVDALLEHEHIDKHAVHTILSTMEKDTNARTIIPFTLPSGHKLSMMVTIDALPRPKGYFLFRGREFVDRRKENLAPGGGGMLHHMAHNLPFGVYTASPEGEVEFVNHTLEQWLGYNRGEMARFGLTLKDLAPEDALGAEQERGGEFEGEATLRCKNGKPLKCQVRQYRIAPDQGKLLGCTGIVTSIEDDAIPKKKLSA